jgi:phosphoenolpyruvate carboxylase
MKPVPAETEGPLDPWRVEVDAALRADIRRLGDELGRTLVRQEGPGLLARNDGQNAGKSR